MDDGSGVLASTGWTSWLRWEGANQSGVWERWRVVLWRKARWRTSLSRQLYGGPIIKAEGFGVLWT